MKQALMIITAAGFLAMLGTGGLAFRNPKRWLLVALVSFFVFLGGTIGLGVMEAKGLEGGWTQPTGTKPQG